MLIDFFCLDTIIWSRLKATVVTGIYVVPIASEGLVVDYFRFVLCNVYGSFGVHVSVSVFACILRAPVRLYVSCQGSGKT